MIQFKQSSALDKDIFDLLSFGVVFQREGLEVLDFLGSRERIDVMLLASLPKLITIPINSLRIDTIAWSID